MQQELNGKGGEAKRKAYQDEVSINLEGFKDYNSKFVDSNKDDIFGATTDPSNDNDHKARMNLCNVKYNEQNVETTYIFAFQQDLKNAQKKRDDKKKAECKGFTNF